MWWLLLLIFRELLQALITLGSFSFPPVPDPVPILAHLPPPPPPPLPPFSSFTLLSHNLIFSMPHRASDNISGVVERNIIWLRFGLNASSGGDVRKLTGVKIGSSEFRSYWGQREDSVRRCLLSSPQLAHSPRRRSCGPATASGSPPSGRSWSASSWRWWPAPRMAPPCPGRRRIPGSRSERRTRTRPSLPCRRDAGRPATRAR